jgi:hypothetical protein
VIVDPQMLLHHVDFAGRRVAFVRAGPHVIADRNVHNFDAEPKHWFHLDELTAAAHASAAEPLHFIFMTDFCGSTLLANALNVLGSVTCLYEVRAFAALAHDKRALDRSLALRSGGPRDAEDWRSALRLAIVTMARTGDGRVVIVKDWPPTNYIISEILRCDAAIRAVFLYSGLEDYLNAVFRRPWRRGFTRRRVLSDLLETDRWPMIDACKLAFTDAQIAAAHWFVAQQAFLGIDDDVLPAIRSLSSEALYSQPIETVAAVARHFGVALGLDEAAAAFASVAGVHSKARGQPYSIAARAEDVRSTADRYSAEISAAVAQATAWRGIYPVPAELPYRL